ncbi:hypothetical protein M8C21_025399, partial [Ambrosia artemisiifolia]
MREQMRELMCVDGLTNDEVKSHLQYGAWKRRICIDDGRVVSNFVAQALRKEPLTVYGDGKQTTSGFNIQPDLSNRYLLGIPIVNPAKLRHRVISRVKRHRLRPNHASMIRVRPVAEHGGDVVKGLRLGGERFNHFQRAATFLSGQRYIMVERAYYLSLLVCHDHPQSRTTTIPHHHGFSCSTLFCAALSYESIMADSAFLKQTMQILAPLPIGFAVFLVHLATIPITGTGINPARSLGAAVIYNKDHAWDDHWIFWVGPFIGAALAALYHQIVIRAIQFKSRFGCVNYPYASE